MREPDPAMREEWQPIRVADPAAWRVRLGLLPLLVFVMAVPLLPATPLPMGGISLVDWQRIVELAALAISVVLFAAFVPAWRGEALVLGVIAACLAIGAASVLSGGVAQRDSWCDWLMWVALIVAAWGAAEAARGDPGGFERLLSRAAALGAAAFIFWTLLVNVIVFLGREPWRAPFVAILGFSSVRQFSDWQSFVLPFVPVVLAASCRRRWLRMVAVVPALLFYSLAFHAQSRSLFAGQLAAHVTLGLVLGRRYWPVLREHAGYWLGGLGAYLLVRLAGWQEGLQAGMSDGLLREGLSRRDELWGYAWQLSRTHPWLGVGPGRFSLYPNPISSSTHNAPLMVAAEWGWPVALAAAAGVTWLVWRAALRLRADGDAVCASAAPAIWLATIALLAQSLVSGVFTAPASQIAVLLGIAWLVAVSRRDGRSAAPLALARPAVRSASAIALLALAAIVASDVERLPERNARFRSCIPRSVLFSPRFWQQGWLFDPCDPAVAPVLTGKSAWVQGIDGKAVVPRDPSASAR